MTGECVHILQEYGASLASVSITPDAGRAVTGGCDMCVRLWDLGSGRGLKVLRGHTDGITTVSITPDGRRAVSGARDEAIRVWDLESGECPMNEEDIPAVYNAISTVSISPDGVLGVSGGDDAFVRVWDWSTTECRKVLKGHTSPICAFAIAPDGDHGISGAHDGSMRLWNLVTGECERVLQENTSGEAYGISAITITPDAARAISVNSVGWIDIWDLAGGERLRHIQGGAADSAGLFSLDGRLALSKDYQNLYVWDLATAKCLRVLRGHTERIDAVLVTPDCQRGVSKDYKTIRVWDFVSGECLEVMERPLNGNTVAAAISGATGVGAERLAPFLRDWDLATYRGIKILNPEARALDAEFVTKERSGNFRRNHNNTLAIRDYATAQCATMGAFGSVFESVHVNGDSVMAGEAEGRIDMITVENHLPGVPVVTVTRLWRFAGQSWDSVFTVRCPSCGQRFEADVFVQGNGPSTWESSGIVGPEHRLRSSGGECRCPHCNRSLRLGPIVCDNSAVLCKTR
jgi:WD40 repeat protein